MKTECRMTKRNRLLRFRLPGRELAEDRREDEVQLVRLATEDSGLLGEVRLCLRHHPEPKLTLPRLLLARADLLPELLPGHRVVRLAVVRPDARPGLHQLPDERFRDD